MRIVSRHEFKVAKSREGLGIRKDFAGKAEEAGDRTLRFTVSTGNPDRSNDVIDQLGWDLSWFRLNPVVLWNHTSQQLPVGKCTEIGLVEGVLKATVEFLPTDTPVCGEFAEAVYQLCRTGFLSATSVGFMPIEFSETDDDARGAGTWSAGMDFHKCQLAEFSICCTPDNPEALIEPGQQIEASAPVIENNEEPTQDAGQKSAALNIAVERDRRARDLTLRGRKFVSI